MNTLFLKKLLYLTSIFGAVLFPFFAFAQDPSITSYKASETSINSGQLVTFSWTLADSGGYSFVVPCLAGLVLKREDGTSLACDTPISTTQITNDAIILTFYNVSGFTKNVTVRLTPKSTAGVDYTAASKDVSISVNTMAQPITSFTTPQLDTVLGQPIVVSWTSQVIAGVNFQVECSSEIKVSSPSYTTAGFLPCGKIIFATDLTPSGSLSLLFSNSSLIPSLSFSNSSLIPFSYTLKLYPAVTANTSYDGSHAVTLTLNIASDTIPDASVTYFTASTTAVNSGEKIKLSWGSDGVGVNIKLSCNQMITATSTQNTNQQFPCNAYIFDPVLSPKGDFTLSFINSSNLDQIITLTAIPSKQAGVYDALRGKSFSLTVRPSAMPVASSSPSPSPLVSPPPSITASPLPAPLVSPPVLPKTIFTEFLKRGSRGAQVSALQEFLKRDTLLYPEGTVSGFFGSLTELAVQRFQAKYNIATKGTPATTGYGVIGPKTRSKLNSL